MQIQWEVLYPKLPKDWDGLVMQPFLWRESLFAIGGLSSGGGNIVRSDDGGATWTQADWSSTELRGNAKTYGKMMGLRNLTAGDGDQLFACGEYGTVLGSRDGGRSWKMAKEAAGSGCQFGLAVRGERLWISGDDGIWYRKIRKGAWVEADDTSGLARIYPIGESLLVIGDGGALKRIATDDSIEDIARGTDEDLYSFTELAPDRGLLVGNNGLIILWDCHEEFTPVKSGVDVSLMASVNLGNGKLLVAGHDQAILLSEDAGATWTRVPGPRDSGALWGACLEAAGTVLVTGDDGLIARGRIS